MAQNIYILSNTKHTAIANLIDQAVMSNGIIEADDLILTEAILLDMAKSCMVEYFYVIIADKEVSFPNFDFSFKPPSWDKVYMHIWNKDTRVRLFNKSEVLKNPSKFTEEALTSGKIILKNIDKVIAKFPTYDIIFLSFNEFTADNNFKKLKDRWPRAKRVNGVVGIKDAHKAAAKLSSTSMFYVVDADAEIVPGFDFNKQLRFLDTSSVYVWHSRNPVNNLEYGYGGVKLFSTHAVLDYNGADVDFTTSVGDGLMVVPEVANITKFDTDPFSTWRSAFRECTKLSSKIISGQLDKETDHRLNTWCTVGNGEFGKYSLTGANDGAIFGREHFNQPDMLRLINDFGWLGKKFNS